MRFILQFPIVDSRQFVKDCGGKLNQPTWPSPIPNKEFMRSIGVVRKRPRGGIQGWIGEDNYSDARNAIKFDTLNPYINKEFGHTISLSIIYRKFYFDGFAVGKFEVGIIAPTIRHLYPSSSEIEELIYH